MVDISLVISSNTQNFGLLYGGIQSVISDNTGITYEVIVVSPHDIPQTFDKTTFIKEENPHGCAAGFNLGAKHAKGKYIALTADDYRLTGGWTNIVSFMANQGARYASFMNGSMNGLSYGHIPCVERSLFESESMRGHFYNETLFHQFLDNDLGFRLHYLEGLSCPCMSNGNWVNDGMQADTDKWASKMRTLRLDGVIFHRIWGRKRDLSNCFLHHECTLSDQEILEIVERQLANDPYKDLYSKIPDIESDWSARSDPGTLQRLGITDRLF